MVLIIEERPGQLAKLAEELAGKCDIEIVTTRIAGFIRLSKPGKDYHTVFCNGQQVIGKRAAIMLALISSLSRSQATTRSAE